MENNQLYVGQSEDFIRRFKQHTNGYGGKTTKRNGVKKLVFLTTCKSRSEARRIETKLKNFSPKKKKQLIANSNKENFKEIGILIERSYSNKTEDIIKFILSNCNDKTLKIFCDFICSDTTYTKLIDNLLETIGDNI